MATEEEAREAADGKFIQEAHVEAVDSEPVHMQTHQDNKLSSMEIKNVGEIRDSTEGTLKIPEDKVLVEAPTEIKLLDHNLNGTASSLNGHMRNEPLHEDSKKDHNQIEAASDGESTDQNNKINKEANECFGHGYTTTEDSSLLKHGKEEEPKGDDQLDEDPMPDTMKTDSDIDQSQLVVDQLDYNTDPEKATQDTQPASMANITNAEVVTEACARVHSPLDGIQDDSDAILDTVDRSTEKDEAAREDGAIHLENGESFPEGTSTAKHMEVVVVAEDQQSKQADATDADVMQEDITKCEETGVSDKMPKSEHADGSVIDAQEELRQETSEDTNGPAYCSQQSNTSASDDTSSEHDSTNCQPLVDIQVQNKEALEEMKDAEAVDTEAAMKQSCVTFEETMNDNEATKPQNSSQKSTISPSEESVPEEIEKEDTVTIEPDDCHRQTQDPETVELDTIETNKSQDTASSDILSNYEESISEENVTITEPNPETQAGLRSAEVMVDTENVKGHGDLAGGTAQEENVETNAIVDISPAKEPELEEGKNTEQVGTENNITPSDLPAERMENGTTEIEAIPYEISVSSISEVSQNDILTAITPCADIQTVLKQESIEDKCNDTTEKPRENQQVISLASDELIRTEDNTAMAEPAYETPLHNVITQGIKDSEDAQTDQFPILDRFPSPGEAAEESKLPRIDTTFDVQEVQELDSTEETRGIETTENEYHQQHRVSSLEEPAVENMPNVDDHQVHNEKTAELKDHETMETEQQLESSKDSEDCRLLKEEETSDHKIITLEDTTNEGTTESQASIENETQASQDVMEKDDTIRSGEQSNDHRQSGDFKHQPQTYEWSVDDESVQKISLGEQHKEDEEVKSQKEQLQEDEHKHENESDDISNEPLVEPKNTENQTTNRTEETDIFEAGQTEAVVNEIPKIEQSLHASEDFTASITDTTMEGITATDKGTEEENRSNSANTSNADAKMDNEEDQEKTGKDNIVPMDYTGGQDETTDEITNEELEPDVASSVEDISYTAPSKDHILENDHIVVPYNAESGGHKDKECTNKVNDVLANQESEKEIVAGMQENKEMQNEAKVVHHAEPCNVDTKTDDTTHNTTGQPRDIEEVVGSNKGLSSIDKPVEQTSEQNNDEQHLSIHHKVKDEMLESTEDNAVEVEATQQKVDTSNVDTNNDGSLPISNSLTKHESEPADDVLQLETEEYTFNKADEIVSYEKTEASNTSVPEAVTFSEEICDKVADADIGLSDESLKTFDETQRNLVASSVVTTSNEESMNEEMEEHKLAVPAHLTMDENTPEQDISVSEKPLPTNPEEQDGEISKEQDEEDICNPDFSDDLKEVEQDLPVSNFLMNLILGKENSDTNGRSKPEVETQQEEIRDGNICLVIPKQEQSLVLPPTENNVEDKLAVEQEKKDAKCPEETHEVVEEQSHDLKLAIETSLETDVEPNKSSHHLELTPFQDKMQDEIDNEILSEKAAEVFTKMKVNTPCQENTEPATQNGNGSLENNLDDLNNTKISEENTLGERQRGLFPEFSDDSRSVNSVPEQTLLLTESGTIDANCLSSEADSVQNPACEIQDKTNESSNIGATSIPDIQVEINEDKTEEKQPATTATTDAEEHVEISNDNLQKSVDHEATSGDQESQIPQHVSDTEIALGLEKENSEGSRSTFMDNKEDSDILVKEGNSIQTAVEVEADDSNMQINQDKKEASDNKNVMQSEKLEESNIQEQQGNDTQQKPSKECHEEDQHFLVKEEDAHETVKSHTETTKIKSNNEKEFSDSKIQERDLNVFPPKEVPEPEESSVDKAKPEFSTDEKQIPKIDELNALEEKTYEGKTKDEEKIKNFADEAMKTEAQVAGQKAAHKKQNLLSGVGSKVKRQLAKVKNVITGKPGHAKPESPRS